MRRVVPSFYECHRDYLTLKPRRPTVSYADDFHVEALVSMLTDTDASSADDRRLAIELQIDVSVPFEWPWVRGLVVPRELQSTSFLSSFLSGAGQSVEIRWFDLAPLKLAMEYQALLESHALELQTAWGLLCARAAC